MSGHASQSPQWQVTEAKAGGREGGAEVGQKSHRVARAQGICEWTGASSEVAKPRGSWDLPLSSILTLGTELAVS